jgi:hypothetical protein
VTVLDILTISQVAEQFQGSGLVWGKYSNYKKFIKVLERLIGLFYLSTGNILRAHALPSIFFLLWIIMLSK